MAVMEVIQPLKMLSKGYLHWFAVGGLGRPSHVDPSASELLNAGSKICAKTFVKTRGTTGAAAGPPHADGSQRQADGVCACQRLLCQSYGNSEFWLSFRTV